MSLVSRLSAGTLLLALGSLALSTCPVRADVLFSTLPFVSNSGYAVQGPSNPLGQGYRELAAKFTLSQTASLDNIQIPFSIFTGDSNAITITLSTSVNNLPGSVLATQTIPANTFTFSNPYSLYTVNFGVSPTLTLGNSYFVDASTTGAASYSWLINQANVNVPIAYRTSPTGSFTAFTGPLAFQVNGTPLVTVPEPGNVASLIGLATMGAGFLSRRRRQQARNAA